MECLLMCESELPKKENPITLHRLKCFNCKESPKYFYDTTWGENCSSECSKESPCEECLLDRDHPHVVVHDPISCPYGFESHDTTKKLAIEGWKQANNPHRGRK